MIKKKKFNVQYNKLNSRLVVDFEDFYRVIEWVSNADEGVLKEIRKCADRAKKKLGVT